VSQKVCPSCNAPNDVNAGFCGSCGAPLGSGQVASSTVPTPPAPPAPSYQPSTPPVPTYQAPPAPTYQPPAPTYQPPAQGYQPPAQGYQQPGYAPGMNADAARAYQAAQANGLVIPAGYAPAGFGVRFVAVLIDGVILFVANWVLALIGLGLISYIAGIAYYIAFWALKGQTPGKMAMGLYVVSADGRPLDWGKAIVRYVGYMVSGFILGIGFLMVAFDDAKRGLHDRIASTLVIKRI